MKYRKAFILSLCLVLAVPSTLIHAAEPAEASTGEQQETAIDEQQEETSEFSGFDEGIDEGTDSTKGNLEGMGMDMEAVFADLKKALDSGKEFQLSASLEDHSGMDISQESLFDLSNMQFVTDTVVDLGTANLKYQILSEQMKSDFSAKDVSGKSENSVELFQNTYGDLAGSLSLKTPKLPKGFSVSEMLKKGSSTIIGLYEDASHSGNFASIKGSISIGNIFTQAKQGLSMPEMTSMDELSNQLHGSSKEVTLQANEAYRNQMNNIRERLKGKQDGLKDSVNKNYLNMVDIDSSKLNIDSKKN